MENTKIIIFLVITILFLILIINYFIYKRLKHKYQLNILESTIKASEREKQRIGKELHDGIAGSIIKLVYETEESQLDLSKKLLKTYNEVRSLSHQLDSYSTHEEFFMDKILDLIPNNFKDKTFTINIEPNHLKLEEPYGTHIYRIIQELITNNLKHAKADRINIKLTKTNRTIELAYKDNGIGIKKLIKGNGFKNMEDRVELMKGKLQLNLENKKGIELLFSIPYKMA